MSAREVAQAILNGDADDELSAVNDAIRGRYDYLNRQAKNAFQLGDRVRFTREARNFGGQTGVVEKKMVKNILVTLADGTGGVRTSPSLLEAYDGPADEVVDSVPW